VTLGIEGAMCRVGSGDGIGAGRSGVLTLERVALASRPWVLRAGFVVRDRVTLDLRCFFATTRVFFDARAVVFDWVFLAAFPAFLVREAFALERETPALELEVALERVLLVA